MYYESHELLMAKAATDLDLHVLQRISDCRLMNK